MCWIVFKRNAAIRPKKFTAGGNDLDQSAEVRPIKEEDCSRRGPITKIEALLDADTMYLTEADCSDPYLILRRTAVRKTWGNSRYARCKMLSGYVSYAVEGFVKAEIC